MLQRFDEEVRVVMEATGAYHLPVLSYLKERKLYVSVINPFVMKEYCCKGLRRGKTDRLDSKSIANYGIDNWYHLDNYEFTEGTYQELKLLGRQYSHYMKMRIESLQVLTNMLDYTMPEIKTLLKGWNESTGKDKLSDFVEEYWHYDNISKKSEKQFINSYQKMGRKEGIPPKRSKSSEDLCYSQGRHPNFIFQYSIDQNVSIGSCSSSTRSR